MFHWICPECGREIPPSVKECQACDPNAALAPTVELPVFSPAAEALPLPPPLPVPTAVAVELPQPQPVVEVLPPAPVAVVKPPAPEPVAVAPPAVEPIVEAAPVVELKPEPAVQAIAVPAPVVDLQPEPSPPVLPEPIAAVEPIIETAPVVDLKPEPEPAVEPEPVAPPQPIVEAAPLVDLQVLDLNPEPAPALEPAPVAEAPADLTPEPVAAVPIAADVRPPVEAVPQPQLAAAPEPLLLAAPEHVANVPVAAAEPEPVAPAIAEPEPAQILLPIAETTALFPVPEFQEPLPEPVVAEAPIKLQELPDPLLALAEEIRAVQADRAAALAPPPESAGLHELAYAVDSQQHDSQQHVSQKPTAPAPGPVEQPTASVAQENVHAAQALATEATAVAVLAPPKPEIVAEIVEEPVAYRAPEPVSLAMPPQPAPEPQAQPDGPILPLAPMQNYRAATSKSILPVPPRPQILSVDSGPRITLPGPTLPPELTRLQDANVVAVIGEKTQTRAKEALGPEKRSGAPGWLVTMVVMLVLLAAGLTIVSYLLPHTVADAKPAPTPAVAATTPAPTGPVSPLSKFIEVTGFRIITSSDPAKKSEVQYMVINHSDADISDVNVFITLRSVKPGQPPVCRFSFKVPALGPFESKEMSSPIEKSTKAVTLPDWQDLRSDVQISQ